MRQTIVIELELEKDQKPYSKEIDCGDHDYDNLMEFFTQIGYEVNSIQSSTVED